MHQNINGLITKSDLLVVNLEELSINNTNVDVLCITEHNMMASDVSQLSIPNYTLATHFCRDDRNGGSCILVKNSLKSKPILEILKLNSPNRFECCALELIDHKIIIICIYRIPKYTKEVFNLFFEKLEVILSKYCLGKKCIICGDFNIDILKNNEQTKTFENLLLSYNFKLKIRQPTRLSSGTCIDNITYNIKGGTAEVIDFALSDHTAQLGTCPVKKSCSLPFWYTYRRDYSLENLQKFKECLDNLSFNDVYEEKDADKAFDIYFNTFKLFYDLCFPLRRIKMYTSKKIKWVSKGIRACSKRKRELLWAYRRAPNSNNKKKLKLYSKRLKLIIALTQKHQNDHKIKNSTNKSKTTWKIINKSKENFPPEPIYQLKVNGKIIKKPSDIAENFNNYFVNVVTSHSNPEKDEDNNFNSDRQYEFNNLLTTKSYNSLFMKPTTAHDIYLIIKSLKNTNSTGYDDISTKVVKYVAATTAPVLSYLVNLSIETGVYPKKLKKTIVTPIFKKDDREIMDFYRPIALIPIYSKIYEKCIYDNLYSFLENFDILAKEQHGFRKKSTINVAIYNFIKKIITNIDTKQSVSALYMDLSKAFDFVNHKVLLNKLEKYGIRGKILSLINSYLTDRAQLTQIKKICSKTKTEKVFLSSEKAVKNGVPQGSVLGPLLFLIYINDLPNITKHSMILFADDSTIVFTKINENDYNLDINNTLDNVVGWLTANNLKLNVSKTKLMDFYNNDITNLNINILGHTINETDETKFLGLIIDKKLTWKSHVDTVCKKLSQYSYALYQLSKTVSQSTALISYHGYVTSTLRYGIIFWGNSTDRENVFKAQKRCLRSICKLRKTDSCKEYYKKLKILTFPCLYIYEVSVFIRNNYKDFDKINNRRHNNLLKAMPRKTAVFSRSILGMGPKIFNKLPKALRDIENLFHFKRELNKFLLERNYYNLNEFFTDNI